MPPASAAPARGLRYALLAPPLVALLRFGTKLALARFLVPEEYGQLVQAGVIAYGVAHLALLGLNEALVAARRPGAALWRRLRRLHQVSGAASAAFMLLLGLGLGAATGDVLLGQLVAALGPMVWLANLATLPTALLVREQAYARLLAVDVVAVVGWAGAQLLLAALGFGPWAIVGGLYANAALAAALSLLLARPFALPEVPDEDALPGVLRYGRHLCGAELMAYFGEQLDTFVVYFALGQAAAGLYNQALNIGGVLLTYTTSLAERSLFPILSARSRADALVPATAETLRLALLYIVPVHVVLALAARPLVDLALPDEWSDTSPLLLLLALASGGRCLDIVGSTALKAAGLGGAVVRLAVARLLLLVVALVVGSALDVWALALGVCLARVAAGLLGVAAAWRGVGVRADGGLRAGALAVLAWCAAFPALSIASESVLGDGPLALLAGELVLAVSCWLVLRWLLDRAALGRELLLVRERLRRGGAAG